MKVLTGKKEFFPGVGKINYEGTSLTILLHIIGMMKIKQ
jgi:hypothetical protein